MAGTAALPDGHWRTAVAIGAEGAALAGQRNFAEAEPLLLQSYKVLSEDPSAMSVFVSDASRRLAVMYSEWGKPDQAAEYESIAEK